MNPKEKARKLVVKWGRVLAKKYCLQKMEMEYSRKNLKQYEYWQQVKTEIENL